MARAKPESRFDRVSIDFLSLSPSFSIVFYHNKVEYQVLLRLVIRWYAPDFGIAPQDPPDDCSRNHRRTRPCTNQHAKGIFIWPPGSSLPCIVVSKKALYEEPETTAGGAPRGRVYSFLRLSYHMRRSCCTVLLVIVDT